jgi:hypothetical protein
VEHNRTIARIADVLGHDVLDRMLAEGARLSPDDAVDLVTVALRGRRSVSASAGACT